MLEIKLARTPEEREQIFKLRYQVYIEELGWLESCPNYEPNHEQQKVEDPLDASANLFMALDRNELIGTLRCNYVKNLDSDYYVKLYQISEKAGDVDKQRTSITSRLVVRHHFRESGTLMVLDVFNFKHLEKVSSPLLREFKNF